MTIRANLQGIVNRATRDTWGQAVSYTPQSTSVAESVTAIYDAAHVAVELGGEVPISTTRPMLLVTAADLSVTPSKGDTLVIGSGTFEVTDVQPDSSGSYRLILGRT